MSRPNEFSLRGSSTLLREDHGGLSGRVRCRDGGAVLDLPGGSGGRGRVLPLERDGFLADLRLRRTEAGVPAAALTLDEVDAAIAAVSDPRDSAGVAAFAAECRQALAGLRLSERHQPAARGRLASAWLADPGARLGWRGLPGYEALAASVPHPAYPTSESRAGFSDEDSLRYAPEYGPQFPLHRVAVPRSRLTVAGRLRRARPAGPRCQRSASPRDSRRPTTCCPCTQSPSATASPSLSLRPAWPGREAGPPGPWSPLVPGCG